MSHEFVFTMQDLGKVVGRDRVILESISLSFLPGAKIGVLRGHSGTVWHAAFDQSSRHVVTVSTDSTARLWDVSTGEPRTIG